MPFYDYECSNCKAVLTDVKQSIKDKPIKSCKECGKKTLQRVIHAPTVFVKEVKTIGQLAASNYKTNKNKIKEQEHKHAESEPKEEVPWYKSNQQVSSKEIGKRSEEHTSELQSH